MKYNILILLLCAICTAVYAELPAGMEEKDLAGVFSAELKGMEVSDRSFSTQYEDAVKMKIAERLQQFRRFNLVWNPGNAVSAGEYSDFIQTSIENRKRSGPSVSADENTDVKISAPSRYFIFATIKNYKEDYSETSRDVTTKDDDGKNKTRRVTDKTASVNFMLSLDFADVETGTRETISAPVHGSDTYTEEDDTDNFWGCFFSGVTAVLSGSTRENMIEDARKDALNDVRGSLVYIVEKNRVLWIDTRIAGVSADTIYLNKGKIWDISAGDEFFQKDSTGAVSLMVRVRKPGNAYSDSSLLWGLPVKGSVIVKNEAAPFSAGMSGGAAGYASSAEIRKNALALISSGKGTPGTISAVYPFVTMNLAYEIGYDWRLQNTYDIMILNKDASYLLDVSFGGGKRVYTGRVSFDIMLMAAGSFMKFNSYYAPGSLSASAFPLVSSSGGDVLVRTDMASLQIKPRLAMNYQMGTHVFVSVFSECGIPVVKDKLTVSVRQDGNELFSHAYAMKILPAVPRAGMMISIRF